MKTVGQIVFIILLVIWISTDAIRPLRMVGDVLTFVTGGLDAAEQRIEQAPTPQ